MFFAYLQQHPRLNLGIQIRGIMEYCSEREIELSSHITINCFDHLLSHRKLRELLSAIDKRNGDRVIVYDMALIPLKLRMKLIKGSVVGIKPQTACTKLMHGLLQNPDGTRVRFPEEY